MSCCEAIAEVRGVTTNQKTLLVLHRYWAELRGQRSFPRRRDIDPLAVRRLLKDVMLVGVEYPPEQAGQRTRPLFRYRLIGTGVTFAAGYDLTGKSFDDLPDVPFRNFCQILFERALTVRAPLSASGTRTIAGETWAFDSIVLPLSDEGDRIDGFIAALIYPKEWNNGLTPRPNWNWHRASGAEQGQG